MKRLVITAQDLNEFKESNAYNRIMNFVISLSQSVRGIPNSKSPSNKNVFILLQILDKISEIADQTEPENTQNRFGNPSFRLFYDKLEQNVGSMLQFIDNEEVSMYLLKSFGDRQRIDYGTGHEASFLCFLLCLFELNFFSESDKCSVVIHVFFGYIRLMRKIQKLYLLEPAGSQGVWGLDDYHTLPFLFGASQLCGHKHIKPRSIRSKEIVDYFAKEYMYLDLIKNIQQIKEMELRWHSPMIDDISSSKSWEKVEQGMLKLFSTKVLEKLPIMQHFLFGKIIPFVNKSGRIGESEHDHVYAMGEEFPQCCGMRFPSAHAAKQYLTPRMPFD